jgi:uncharacterized protein (DUF885 family)
MSEFAELEQRLMAALDRIEAAAEKTPSQDGVDPEEVNRLKAALDDAERAREAAEAQLHDLREQHSQTFDQLEESLNSQRKTTTALDTELQRLRQVNKLLEDNNRALRLACETGQVDAALINQAMLAELESMRTQRATEKAEIEAAMAAIEPLLISTGGTA